MCVCDLLMRVFWWSIHKITSSGAYQSDSLPPHLMIKKKNHSFGIGQYVYPQLSQAATFGIRALVRKFETLLIPIRIRNVPAQIIHINNWNKNITLYIRLTATPRTKLTVYKNSYVKNLHKRQTKRKSSVQTFTEKKYQTKRNKWPIIMAAKTCYCL